ncbi:MAG: acyltransferase [Chiayiivirga sp.]|jgi:exopolysaccharide production protein ExoZ|nr:acyltransferase [Chiayiivirga sp.]
MTASTRPEDRDRLDGLQVLRAVAALSVVVFHAGRYVADRVPEAAWRWGEFGVDVFFVLSGCVMAWATRPGTPALAFFARRFARIAPMYWLATLVVAVALWQWPSLFHAAVLDPMHLAQSLAFLPHYSPGAPDQIWPLFVPGWTLNYEMYFYLVFAATLPWITSAGWRVVVVTALLAMGVAVARPFSGPAAPALGRIPRPAAGVRVRIRNGRGARAAVRCSTIGVACRGHRAGGRTDDVLDGHDRNPLGKRRASRRPRWCSLWLRSDGCDPGWGRAMTWLGDASYSLYLIHPYLVGAVWLVWQRHVPDAGPVGAWGFITACVVACAAAALPIHRRIEQPLVRWTLRRLVPTPPSPVAGVT